MTDKMDGDAMAEAYVGMEADGADTAEGTTASGQPSEQQARNDEAGSDIGREPEDDDAASGYNGPGPLHIPMAAPSVSHAVVRPGSAPPTRRDPTRSYLCWNPFGTVVRREAADADEVRVDIEFAALAGQGGDRDGSGSQGGALGRAASAGRVQINENAAGVNCATVGAAGALLCTPEEEEDVDPDEGARLKREARKRGERYAPG